MDPHASELCDRAWVRVAGWHAPAGKAMHWLDRGGFIRSDADYRVLFGGFTVTRSYTIRSGICDYGVYVLRRDETLTIDHA